MAVANPPGTMRIATKTMSEIPSSTTAAIANRVRMNRSIAVRVRSNRAKRPAAEQFPAAEMVTTTLRSCGRNVLDHMPVRQHETVGSRQLDPVDQIAGPVNEVVTGGEELEVALGGDLGFDLREDGFALVRIDGGRELAQQRFDADA